MTRNEQRAAGVLHRHHENCNDAAQALNIAGLIAPDLPEPQITPTGCTFHEEGSPYGVDVTVYKTSDNEVYAYADDEFGTDLVSMPPEEARKMAARLLAAADYAERNP